jgi:hypothetical protein
MKTIRAIRRHARHTHLRITLLLICALVLTGRESGRQDVLQAQATPGCPAYPNNPVACENQLPGDADWDLSGRGAGDPSIQGFAADMSVNVGQRVNFKIDTPSTDYKIDIYRLGYYSGLGARKVATITPSATLPQDQPSCVSDQTTGLVDCGTWQVSAFWDVPIGAVSGVYLAKPTRRDAVDASSHIVFLVRNDAHQADVVFQTSDTTWQAYNTYGGSSLYCGDALSNSAAAYACPGRAAKVSYNRPFLTRAGGDARSFLFSGEYPAIRWLEANGFNVKYWSGIDTDRRGTDLIGSKKPKIFLSVGHDEYWSGAQRTHVENARNAGVNLAFLSGNEVYWKTRWEPSIDGNGTPYRTLVSYKETLNNAKIDPSSEWTGTWRDTRFSPPSDGGRPENALIGAIWTVNCCTADFKVPASMAPLRFWRNTRVADLTTGAATLAPGTLGYEWGEALENGFQPAGLVRLSSTTVPNQEKLIDFGAQVGLGTATHSLVLYRHNSGALVFGASTVQWSWGLDGEHDGDFHTPDQAVQQSTINLFADMGNVQPATLQVGADPLRPLMTAAQSTDIFAPTSSITSPSLGGTVESGMRVNITGTATDSGGGQVAGVEVSVDGGATWRAAQGRTAWTFEWTPGSPGTAAIRTRAIDDSGNLESAGAGVSVTVGTGVCPCPNLWRATTTPESTGGLSDFPESNALELGVKFRSDVDGYISGVRFYKGLGNTGTHLGHLWTASGQLLATATFINETPSGWQQVLFDAPVPITANTLYVASYHTNVGHYAVTPGMFVSGPVDAPPLHAPSTGEVGGNGVFAVGATTFPTNSFNGNYYWVDVVFATSTVDETEPMVANVRELAIDSSKLEVSWSTDEEASGRVEYSTDATFPAATTLSVSSSEFKTSHRLTITGLAANTTYYLRIVATDPTGNRATFDAPSFTLPGPTLRDTADEDFMAGSGGGVYVAATGNGELTLAPTLGAEFAGNALPAGWKSTPWSTGGGSSVNNGVLRVDGSRVGTCTDDGNGNCNEIGAYTPGRSLEFVATFTGDAFQHAGLAVRFDSGQEPWAIFSTITGGNLYARTNTGSQLEEFLIGGTYLGSPHRYRIDWNANGTVSYFIDGALIHNSDFVVNGPLRPIAASDFSVFGGVVTVDWVRLTPYTSAGQFLSRVFDAQTSAIWKSIQWSAKTPAGTTLNISVRGGETANPDDGLWTPFTPVAAPGALDLASRYIQYKVEMTTADPSRTPSLEDIILTTGEAPQAVADAFNVAQNRTRIFPASGPGSLTFNDVDGDTANEALRVVAIIPPSHGSAVLNADGSILYAPTANYNGPDVFSYTVSDGLLTSSASVALTVTFVNQAPEANADFYQVNEDTPLIVPAPLGLLANDLDVEGNSALRVVLVSPPAVGMLSLSPTGAFTYTPPENFANTVTFAYKANDGDLDSQVAIVQILINEVNDPPQTPRADTYTAQLNQPLIVAPRGVLDNDLDTEIAGTPSLQAQLMQTTQNGVLSFSNDGSFTYVPNADFLGVDTFKYRSIDQQNAISALDATVTITVAIKAVSETVDSGGTVGTGVGVTSDEPLVSTVTTPTPARVSIAQGVIADSQSPSGYTFLNQQVNITVADATGTEVTATAANPLVFTFEIDMSLVPAGQNQNTFEVFRNGVLVPNCLGATSIPAANLDPCVSRRENGTRIKLTILTSHASHWNMGLAESSLGDDVVAHNDGVFSTNFEIPLLKEAPGVLGNDFGPGTLTAVLSGTPEGGTVELQPSGAFIFTPAAGHCGPARFQYYAQTATDVSDIATVLLMVNCLPSAGDDTVTVPEDSGPNAITVLANDTDPDAGQTLRVSDVTQGANGTVVAGPSGMWLTYQPNANFTGTDTFTYTVADNKGGTDIGTVNVTVSNINDVPSFTKGANQTLNEDAGPQSVFNWATNISAGPSESGQSLEFLVTNDNPAFFAVAPAIDAAGTLTFLAAPNANGVATVAVQLRDNGGSADGGIDTSASQTFTITVSAVNDAPSFVKGADESLSEDFGARTVSGWATAISAGPANEAGQTLTFVVSNDNNALFSTQPAIAADGTLTYDAAPNANGTANVSVLLRDSGGTANGGVDASAAQAFKITLYLVNDAPSFSKGANQTVNEDAGAATVAAWATSISAGPADEAGQVLNFIVSNDNAALFAVQPAVAPNGTLTYTPAANVFGTANVAVQLHDNGGTANGGADTSAAQSFSIAVNAVNDAPSFTKGADQVLYGNPPAQTVSNWATAITRGPANESGQTVSFVVTNTNNALFSSQPAVSSSGTLTFTPAPNMNGTAMVTAVLKDNGGTLNGGVDASVPQTFLIAVNVAQTQTTVTTSNPQSLAGLPITFTATVNVVAPAVGMPTGNVTFMRGTTALATRPLANGVATYSLTNLGIGTHSITAVYSGLGNFLPSTSAALTQTVGASAMLNVNFQIQAVLDNTNRPRVQQIPVVGAEVRVYTRKDTCTNGIIVSGQPRMWGPIFDGPDGYNPTGTDLPGCPVVKSGTYSAVGVTNANGDVQIIVPPLTTANSDYIIIGRTLEFNATQTAATPDPMYSEKTVASLKAGDIKRAMLHQVRLFNGKKVPGKDIEEYGSYLAIVEPEYIEWTSDVEQYPFILITEGEWGVTTAVEPPEGFIADYPELTVEIADEVSALQFTITDIGSDWTKTKISHTIRHKGKTKKRDSDVPMYDRKPTAAKNDKVKVSVNSSNNVLDVLDNDAHSHSKRPLAVTAVTMPDHGFATIAGDGSVTYTPEAGFAGEDSFVYTMVDATGAESTAVVTISVKGNDHDMELAATAAGDPASADVGDAFVARALPAILRSRVRVRARTRTRRANG